MKVTHSVQKLLKLDDILNDLWIFVMFTPSENLPVFQSPKWGSEDCGFDSHLDIRNCYSKGMVSSNCIPAKVL